jgi:hypothetical protein
MLPIISRNRIKVRVWFRGHTCNMFLKVINIKYIAHDMFPIHPIGCSEGFQDMHRMEIWYINACYLYNFRHDIRWICEWGYGYIDWLCDWGW